MAQAMADGLSRHTALQQSPVTIRVPQFWPELCAADVLTMEYVEGHRAASLAIAALPRLRAMSWVKRCCSFSLPRYLIWD